MTTAVASPPSFQPLSRLGWNSSAGAAGGLNSMSADEVSRMFMPQGKSIQRTNSSSSASSSNSSNATISSSQQQQPPPPPPPPPNSVSHGESGQWSSKRKARGGFWPASKAERVSDMASPHPQGSNTAMSIPNGTALAPAHQSSPVVPSQQNGVRNAESANPAGDSPAVLVLVPLNGTFEKKQINVPLYPGVLKVGRQTNAKTVPSLLNGYFDSKVLSRAHAEIWADRTGKIWIRDVKSSNGTFINGHRLSPENRDSEPREIREHDTLELGIDIISEDQRSILHHKVSAKVEYAGIPGGPNVLDLNYGDIDPSQGGGGLLSSPLSQSGGQHRGRPGAPYNRSGASSISAGCPMSALGQQRQMHMWASPMGVEHLVKALSNETRAAKQQAQDLDQTTDFLSSLLSSDRPSGKDPKPQADSNPSFRLANEKLSKMASVSRFSDPPTPPPRQPLPERPDVSHPSPLETGGISPLKRSDTARPGNSVGCSPTNSHSSQILSLVEALSSAKKEVDSQGTRVKHLENMLRQERLARESAEERARRFEQGASYRPIPRTGQETEYSNAPETGSGEAPPRVTSKLVANQGLATSVSVADDTISTEDQLESRLKQMVDEMDKMKYDMHNFQRRAEAAESDAASKRASLADMIERLRQGNEEAAVAAEREILADDSPEGQQRARLGGTEPRTSFSTMTATMSSSLLTRKQSRLPNGHVANAAPPKLPEPLERAMTTLLRTASSSPDGQQQQWLAQSAPYASMLGVVLVGVGLMAYLNSWQKMEK